MSSERSSTIGKERRTNYALQAQSCDEFIPLLPDGLPPRPEYFGRDVELNRQGATALDRIPPPVSVRAHPRSFACKPKSTLGRH
jgi:hydroxyacylglutathione hydrolase